MTKQEFAEKVSKMKSPEIEEINPGGGYDLLVTCWVIRDRDDVANKFCTPVVRLTEREYRNRNLSDFYSREKHFRDKYKRWLQECLEG